jgi:hypothetical protein
MSVGLNKLSLLKKNDLYLYLKDNNSFAFSVTIINIICSIVIIISKLNNIYIYESSTWLNTVIIKLINTYSLTRKN